MQRTLWTDRKFNFDFPVGLFPNIIERLRGTPARLKEMTSTLTEKEAEYKPGNKWSIKEQIGHLGDLEALHEGRINDFLLRKESLRPADMTNAATNTAKHNTSSLADLIHNFASKRIIFVSRLEQLSDEIHEVKSLHPRLKVLMRPVDIAYFTSEHDDHHLTSIRELMK
ncbi:MAG: DinB family protein [Saprospiraceae bacterium]|uniref:DinB family protein n=1 Tax=Candidatus Opimibacter skivensis TaxID=2982028 RepID=A0A9D7SV45_9BACT|nr:DinB family protein [Candidatus Opimibacter skivensis]